MLNIQRIPTVARRTELVDSHSRLVVRIDDFPQPLGPYFVNFGPSDQIFDPLYGENCLLKLVLVWGR